MLIDTHAHLNFEAYKNDLNDVIKRCNELKMAVINVGAQFETSQKAQELTKYENFYASLGLHPIHVFDEDFFVNDYKQLISEKVVAIGETGLDYFHIKEKNISLDKVLEKQKQVFISHIDLAKSNNLPLILHGRNSVDVQTCYSDMLRILKSDNYNNAVVHCFGSNLDDAKAVLNFGLYIGFTGIITYKNATDLREVVKFAPLDKILIETDSPYLAPQKYRGERNEPSYVIEVARQIAEIKNLSLKKVIDSTWENAKKLFNI